MTRPDRFNPENSTTLDPCPSCDETAEGYFLGTSEDDDGVEVAGWLCSECDTVVEENVRTGDMIEVEGGDSNA